MSLDFITRSFYWLPRVGGALTGTYEAIPEGANNYISDTALLAPGYKPLPLPTWMPRQVFISGFWAGFGLSRGLTPPEGVGITLYVDPQGIGYKTGITPGAEAGSDMTRFISLLQCWSVSNDYVQFFKGNLADPVLLDRDAGDKFIVELDTNPILDWFYMEMRFIVPSGSQPSFRETGY